MALVKWFGVLAAALVLSAAPAAAADNVEIEVCNITENDVYFSVAGFDADSPGLEWRSEGWWEVEAYECRELSLSTFLGRHLFLYAESSTGTWEGEYLFCVHTTDKFTLKGDRNCENHGDGYAAKRFFHRTNRVGVYTVNLTD